GCRLDESTDNNRPAARARGEHDTDGPNVLGGPRATIETSSGGGVRGLRAWLHTYPRTRPAQPCSIAEHARTHGPSPERNGTSPEHQPRATSLRTTSHHHAMGLAPQLARRLVASWNGKERSTGWSRHPEPRPQ